jgi:hypothetical protein
MLLIREIRNINEKQRQLYQLKAEARRIGFLDGSGAGEEKFS